MSKSVVTAREVREFFQSHPKSLAALSEAAQHTVRSGARGRLHAEAVKVHNQRRRGRQYVTGASKDAAAQAQAEAQAARKAAEKAAAEAGVTLGSRGPIPKSLLSQTKG